MKVHISKDQVEYFISSLTLVSLAEIILYADGKAVARRLSRKEVVTGLEKEMWKQVIEVDEGITESLQNCILNGDFYLRAVDATLKSAKKQRDYSKGEFCLEKVTPMLYIAAAGYVTDRELRDAIVFALSESHPEAPDGIESAGKAKPSQQPEKLTLATFNATKKLLDKTQKTAQRFQAVVSELENDDYVQKELDNANKQAEKATQKNTKKAGRKSAKSKANNPKRRKKTRH